MYIKSNKLFLTKYEIKHNIEPDINNVKEQLENPYFKIYSLTSLVSKIYHINSNDKLLGYKLHNLYDMANNTSKYYRICYINKRNGGKRKLTIPNNELKYVLEYFTKHLFRNREISKHAFAYLKGRSIIDNAKYHLNHEYMLKLDISNFFDSITYKMVYQVCLEKGYSKNIRTLITNLTTLNGTLPQGAPTSPFLSNLVMKRFDDLMHDFSLEKGFTYTRYSDDITISSNKEIDCSLAISYISKNLYSLYRMKLNKNKTIYLKGNKEKIVTGLRVDNSIKLPTKYIKNIKQDIYYLSRFGTSKHIQNLKDRHKLANNINETQYLVSLYARINYGLYIEPKNKKLNEYKEWFDNIHMLVKGNQVSLDRYNLLFREYDDFSYDKSIKLEELSDFDLMRYYIEIGDKNKALRKYKDRDDPIVNMYYLIISGKNIDYVDYDIDYYLRSLRSKTRTNKDACYVLGLLYLNGIGLRQNLQLAEKYLLKAANMSDCYAYRVLISHFKNDKRKNEYIERAANLGNPRMQYEFALSLEDKKQQLYYLKKSCENGYLKANKEYKKRLLDYLKI